MEYYIHFVWYIVLLLLLLFLLLTSSHHYRFEGGDKDLREMIERDILDRTPKVTWEDIAGKNNHFYTLLSLFNLCLFFLFTLPII